MHLRKMAAAACCLAAALAAFYSEPSPDTLEQAHARRPRDSAVTVELALSLENAGRPRQAEQLLLFAAAHDRLYAPAWALANFYFRQDNRPEFWLWARRAADIQSYDLRPLLRLASAYETEPRTVLAHLGDRPEILRPYLDLLIGEDRMEAAAFIAACLEAHGDPSDRPRLEAFALRKIRSEAQRRRPDL